MSDFKTGSIKIRNETEQKRNVALKYAEGALMDEQIFSRNFMINSSAE